MARKLAYLILTLAGVSLILYAGCTEQDNPVMDFEQSAAQPFQAPVPFEVLRYAPLGGPNEMSRIISVAYASEEPPNIPQPPFPVLYLLHDFEGDGNYWERYSLQTVVDDMFSKGEIGRMLIVTVGADTRLGGSFYRNSVSSGQYAELIGRTIAHIEEHGTFNAYLPPGAEYTARAISGHGMGGYGAMRYAMEHPDMFGSVSSLSGPLSFNATLASDILPAGQSWLEYWTDKVLTESGIPTGDEDAFFTNLSAQTADPFIERPFTRMFYAMAAAFSPRPLEVYAPVLEVDTCLICTRLNGCDDISQYRKCYPCSLFAAVPLGRTTLTTFNGLGDRPACSDPVVPEDLGIDFPFDWNGARVDSVWNLWLDDDCRTFAEANPAVFDHMDVYFDCGVEDEFGFLGQNRDFHNALEGMGVAHEYEEYQSAQGLPADHSTLIVKRLRKILKFHSDRFAQPRGWDSDH
jgi:S-formylglutathione hydrolase FrmB